MIKSQLQAVIEVAHNFAIVMAHTPREHVKKPKKLKVKRKERKIKRKRNQSNCYQKVNQIT